MLNGVHRCFGGKVLSSNHPFAPHSAENTHVPWSKVAMVIPPLIGNPYNGYINPYYWVDDHPLLYGNNWSLDPGTHKDLPTQGSTSAKINPQTSPNKSPNKGENS